MTYDITVKHLGETHVVKAQADESLFAVLACNGLVNSETCGGHGVCGKCGVRVIAGNVPCASPAEQKALQRYAGSDGMRLACLLRVASDMHIETLRQNGSAVILTDGIDQRLALKPQWSKRYFSETDITEWLLDGVTVARRQGQARLLALAVDIGTTTVVAYLIDLEDGATLAIQSGVNAQAAYGADVISRAQMTMEQGEGLHTLSALIRDQINSLAQAACSAAGVHSGDIVHAGIVGNSVMTHIFASLPVNTIAVAPYTPQYTRGFDMGAEAAGLRLHPSARVRLLPCISGYVGADTVAAAMACDFDRSDALCLLLDIGTNGEMMLGGKDRLIACATAAGPAFEGGHIRFGMSGVTGAIDRVWVEHGKLRTSTIGEAQAQGLCGSGLVDAVAALIDARCLDETGFLDGGAATVSAVAERLVDMDGDVVFMLRTRAEGAARDIYLTQQDIREVQLAKGAIAAGIRILLQTWGASEADVRKVYLAGGFGTYIDYNSACAIGLLPKTMRGRIVPVGNAAGTGAQMTVRNSECIERAERIRDMAQYLELAEVKSFQDIFMDEMMFAVEG